MDGSRITSTKNPLVRRFRAAAAGEVPGRLVAEGLRLVAEAVASGLGIEEYAWSERLRSHAGGADLLARLEATGAVGHACGDRVLERLSSLGTPQAVVAIARCPSAGLPDVLSSEAVPLVLVADGVQDPGNLGALVRSAEAAGATGLLALAGSANPFRDKAVRGSMGSVFRLPCVADVVPAEAVGFLRQHGLQIVVADPAGDPFWRVDLKQPTALVVGREGSGVAPELAAAAVGRVGIPIAEPVDSLNVAVAAGVLLFEARRQRG